MFKIVVVKPFDEFKVGDVLETVMYDDFYSIKKYIVENYTVNGLVVKAIRC